MSDPQEPNKCCAQCMNTKPHTYGRCNKALQCPCHKAPVYEEPNKCCKKCYRKYNNGVRVDCCADPSCPCHKAPVAPAREPFLVVPPVMKKMLPNDEQLIEAAPLPVAPAVCGFPLPGVDNFCINTLPCKDHMSMGERYTTADGDGSHIRAVAKAINEFPPAQEKGEAWEEELAKEFEEYCERNTNWERHDIISDWWLSHITALLKDKDEAIQQARREGVTENTSDGFHTFKELYDFRRVFNAALFNEWATQGKYQVHKSKKHGDGEECFGGGWFIVMATLPSGQISNHYELKHWDEFRCDEREKADEWDGHTAQDVLARLQALHPTKPKE